MTTSCETNIVPSQQPLNSWQKSALDWVARLQGGRDVVIAIDLTESVGLFEYVYLVSAQTANNYKIVSQSKLANVIAYKIFLDFSGEVASLLRSQKDNFLKHMLHLDQHPRPNVQRYLTFGMASIQLKQDIQLFLQELLHPANRDFSLLSARR